jgi:hypothetical protein
MVFFESLSEYFTHWSWLVLAIAMFGLEILAPGIAFMWMAGAAVVVGGVVFAMPDITWQTQMVMFVVLSLISVYGGRLYIKNNPIESEDKTLNQRGSQYVGHIYDVVEPITDGHGRINVGDTVWNAEGPNVAVGSKVRVVSVHGTALVVEPVDG